MLEEVSATGCQTLTGLMLVTPACICLLHLYYTAHLFPSLWNVFLPGWWVKSVYRSLETPVTVALIPGEKQLWRALHGNIQTDNNTVSHGWTGVVRCFYHIHKTPTVIVFTCYYRNSLCVVYNSLIWTWTYVVCKTCFSAFCSCVIVCVFHNFA